MPGPATFLSPDAWWFFILLGVLWEGIEVIVGKIFKGSNFKRQAMRTDSSIEYSGNWWESLSRPNDRWSGSFKDIGFDIAGVAVGLALRRAYDDNQKKKKS